MTVTVIVSCKSISKDLELAQLEKTKTLCQYIIRVSARSLEVENCSYVIGLLNSS